MFRVLGEFKYSAPTQTLYIPSLLGENSNFPDGQDLQLIDEDTNSQSMQSNPHNKATADPEFLDGLVTSVALV